MMLREILKDCDYAGRFPEDETIMDRDVSGVAYDSRVVKEGFLFVAIKGEKYDGHDFVNDAIRRGAVAAVIENGEKETPQPRIEEAVPQPCYIHVRNSRRALACISSNFYGRPSESLTLIGITGTNGKTTTTYIMKSVLEAWGKHVGLIGTIQYMIKEKAYPAPHTTPESLEFQGLLRKMISSGCTHVVTEVSSHALAQGRADGAVFHTAVFTNLTRDHLDFHKTMEDYFRAKERLFLELLDESGTAVINLDDPYGERLYSVLRMSRPGLNILTYGLETGADIVAHDINFSSERLKFTISYRGAAYRISSMLTGMPNVYNIMSAVGASISLRIPWHTILGGVESTGNIAGRFEKVDVGQRFLCIIDYAHTEDALERLINTARQLIFPAGPPINRGEHEGVGDFARAESATPRVITVFGCGGDRDRGKRPRMGEVATRLSDLVIVTSDNPRSEDPMDIIGDIVRGMTGDRYLIEPERRKAIKKAIEMARDGDIILVAGKGHEDYQEIEGVRYLFSDREVAREAIMMKMQKSK